jgi:beta-phosphoglucomutase family hydrolase
VVGLEFGCFVVTSPVGYSPAGVGYLWVFLDGPFLILFDGCMSFSRPLTLATICSAKRAVIFDMDGTMVHNMPAHHKAWDIFFEHHNLHLTPQEYAEKVSTKQDDEIMRNLFGTSISEQDIARYTQEKESCYRELYREHVVAVPGLCELLERLHARAIPLGVATTAVRENRDLVFDALSVRPFFSVVVGDEDVARGKPDPEIYFTAARLLGVDPAECLVFEDSPAGVTAAHRAGMTVIGVLTSYTKQDLALADDWICDYREIQ